MSGRNLDGETCLFVVAQRPFANVSNLFCTLIPVLHEDGRRPDPLDFPTTGDVFWMVVAGKRHLAEPGRLVTGPLGPSESRNVPGKASYQVAREEVEAAPQESYVELLTVPPQAVSEPRQLVSGRVVVQLDHRPLSHVYVIWGGSLFGPLRATGEQTGDATGLWRVTLATATPDNTCLRLPLTILASLSSGAHATFSAEVSLTDQHPTKTQRRQTCHYRVVRADALEAVTPADAPRLVLLSEEAVVQKCAKDLLSRSKKQQLAALLKELGEIADSKPGVEEDVKETIRSLRDRLNLQEQCGRQLADALLASDLLGTFLDEARGKVEEEYLKKHTGRLRGEIEEKLETLQAQLLDAEARKRRLDDEIESALRDAKAEQRRKLAEERDEFDRKLESDLARVAAERAGLERQGVFLKSNLEDVARRIGENRDELVNQFLAISPLLSQLAILPTAGGAQSAPPSGPSPAASRPFPVPAFAPREAPAKLTEGEFFERFCLHVKASGFRHRTLDLAAFHLSVKCNDLTVLGGQPGTGKSSLARLYAEALGGTGDESEPRRFLHVAVSPSWLDSRDLLGYTNALDRRFLPAESGLYEFLVTAQVEDRRRGPDAAIYLVCLDEMNLSQVEHYFGTFLQALERPPGQREVPCFSRAVVAPDDPFAEWPALSLPPNLRFVGTVNFDETTRQLSQRVLDRVNLVRLRPPDLMDGEDPKPVPAAGPPVTGRHLRDWVGAAPKLGAALGQLLDDLREPLGRLGCPLHPRRLHAIRKFVGSAAGVCGPDEALDLQIAQRVLPQVRNLFGARAGESLGQVRAALARHAPGLPESLYWLDSLGDASPPAES